MNYEFVIPLDDSKLVVNFMDLSHIILLATEVAAETADPGILGSLGIDLKLFIAQLVNFAVVIFILWKWVFKPVGGALEKRRQRIDQSLKEAEEIEQRVQSFERDHEERLNKSRKEAEAVAQKASQTAGEMKTQIQQEAREEAERIIKGAKQTVEAEKKQAIEEIRHEVAELTLMAAEKVLSMEIDKEKDRKIIEETLKGTKK